MIFRFILWSIIITFVLRFIFRIVIPIFRVTSVAHGKIREMQQQMEEMQKKSNTPPPAAKPRQVDGDYIDYEEVK